MMKLKVYQLGVIATYELYVPDDCSVFDLKKLLVELTRCPIEIQKIIFKDTLCDNNNNKLTDYDIVDNSTLCLILNIMGD